MSPKSRHEQLLTWIQANGFGSIDELAEAFSVTPQTIRRDLSFLASQGLVKRYHGGVVPANISTTNTSYQTRKQECSEEKEKIGEAIAQALPDESSVFINIGTTNEALARAIKPEQRLTVITNSLHVASILAGHETTKVILAGGEIRSSDGGIIGEATVDFINQFKVDIGIIGISGIDQDGSLLDFDYHEVRVSQAIMNNSRRIYLGADHSKFGRKAMVRLGHIQKLHCLFTDEQPEAEFVEIIQRHQVQLVQA